MQAPKAVVFDLGKVLLDFDYARAVRAMISRCAVSSEELLGMINQSSLLLEYESGSLTSAQFFEEIRRLARYRGEFEDFESVFGNIFTPLPEMIALHERLRQAGVPTYVFSNTNEIAVRSIRRSFPFFAHFSGYIFSYEHRVLKPRREIYEIVERITGQAGPRLLYIDDRLENIEQGRAMGWRVIHHASSETSIRAVREQFGRTLPEKG